MSTNASAVPGNGANLEIPLTAEVRKAYEDQYDKQEAAIQATNDPDLKALLLAQQDPVAQVISADNQARKEETTAAFEAVSDQIKKTNDGLRGLEEQIKTINSDISMCGEVLDGITEVLSLTGL